MTDDKSYAHFLSYDSRKYFFIILGPQWGCKEARKRVDRLRRCIFGFADESKWYNSNSLDYLGQSRDSCRSVSRDNIMPSARVNYDFYLQCYNCYVCVQAYKDKTRSLHSIHFIYYKFVTCHNFESKTSRNIFSMCINKILSWVHFYILYYTERILFHLVVLESWLNKINLSTYVHYMLWVMLLVEVIPYWYTYYVYY